MEQTQEMNFDNKVISKIVKDFTNLMANDIRFKKYFKLHTGTAYEILCEYMKFSFCFVEPCVQAMIDEDYALVSKIKWLLESIEMTIITKLKELRPEVYEELADRLLIILPKYFSIINDSVKNVTKIKK